MATVSANNFIKNAGGYIDKAAKQSSAILVAADGGEVVILNAKTYRSLMETAYLNSIPNLSEDIISGMNTPANECVELDWKNEL